MGKINEILVVTHTHHDVGYTHVPDLISRMHEACIYDAIELCEQDQESDERSQFRWTVEISRPMAQFLRNASEADIKRLQTQMANGRMAVTASYMHMTQLVGHEDYVRYFMPVRDFRHKYNLPVSVVQHGDINGLSWGVVPLMAEAGLDTLVMALNPDHGRAPFEQPSAFYWEGQDGSRILVWLSIQYMSPAYHWNMAYGTADGAVEPLKEMIARLEERDDYPFDFAVIHFAEDNMMPHNAVCSAVRDWNTRDPANGVPMRILTIDQAMARAKEQATPENVPVVRGEWADWWSHGHASTAYEVGVGRQAQAEIRSAEVVRSLARIANPESLNKRAPFAPLESHVFNWYRSWGRVPSGAEWGRRVDNVYENLLLFEEHTWGTFETVTRTFSHFTQAHWNLKARFPFEAEVEGRDLAREAVANLIVALPAGEEAVLVVNPLSDSRDELVTFRTVDGDRTVLIKDIPPLGARAVLWSELKEDAESREVEIVGGTPAVLENRFYRLEVDAASASITSLVDKETGREWVDPDAMAGIGGVVYEEADPTDDHPAMQIHRSNFHPSQPGPRFNRTAASGKGDVTLARTAYGATLSFESSGPTMPLIQTSVTLYDDIKRIDIALTLDKEENLNMEGVFVLFPFAVQKPTFLFESANTVYRAGEEQLADSCPDWYSIQHGAAVTDGAASVLWATREAPVLQPDHFTTGEWNRELKAERGHIYSWLMNNLYFTNFKAAQSGQSNYNYRITTLDGEATPSEVRRWGELYGVPPIARIAPVQPGSYRWLEVGPASIVVQILKPAIDDPESFILRLKETTGQPTETTINWLGSGEVDVFQTDYLELAPLKEIKGAGRAFNVMLAPNQLATFKIVPR